MTSRLYKINHIGFLVNDCVRNPIFKFSISMSFLAVLASGCAPWKNEDYSDIDASMLLRTINFHDYAKGGYEIRSRNPYLTQRITKISSMETAVNEVLIEKGSGMNISDQAREYLKKDNFNCSFSECIRSFNLHEIYGDAFIPLNVQLGRIDEHSYTRTWNFIISTRKGVNGFTAIYYSES